MKKVILEEFGNYSITECGKIFNSKGKQLKWGINPDGYYTITLTFPDGKRTCRRRARLLAQTFIPNPYNLPVVNHIDHDRTNDSLDNLEWVTHKDNNVKSIELYPEKHKGMAKISKELAVDICEMISNGVTNKQICEDLNVPLDVVSHIRKGNTWKEVSVGYDMKRSVRVLTDEMVEWVCIKINEGLTNREILDLNIYPEVSYSSLKRIRRKKCHRHITEKLLN